MNLKAARLPMAAFVWIEAWLVLPWLASYLPLPGPLGHLYVWHRVWALLVLPAFITAEAIAGDGPPRPLWFFSVTVTGALLEALYLLHQVPHPDIGSVVKRWLASAMALTAMALSNQPRRDSTPPALQISASGALVFAFAARSTWADGLSGLVLAAALASLWLSRQRAD